MWTHYSCTQLPDYVMIALTNSNRKHVCMACTVQGYEDYNDLLSELNECLLSEKEDREEEDQGRATPDNQSSLPAQMQKESTETTAPTSGQGGLGSTPEDIDFSNIPPN